MRRQAISLLSCPFCGVPLRVVEARSRFDGDDLRSGVLTCSCAAYPVVDGIPYVRADAVGRALLGLVAGDDDVALATALTGRAPAADEVLALVRRRSATTFREAMSVLVEPGEADYFLLRFSDPPFLAGSTALAALLGHSSCAAGPLLDLGVGAGHFTRTMLMHAARPVVAADISFRNLWLTREYLAPDAVPVCCDANAPLPLPEATFTTVFSCDAFHYVWQRRLLAAELQRVLAPAGTLLLAHLHNAEVDNVSAGMPLTVDGYRRLFAGLRPRLYTEGHLLDAALSDGTVDLTAVPPDEILRQAAALVLVGTRDPSVYTVHRTDPPHAAGAVLNPLYRPTGDDHTYELSFPSEGYDLEYGAARTYLPERVSAPDPHGSPRLVFLDAPERYL